MLANQNVPIPSEMISELCRRWRVTELSLFGSVLRDDFRPESDVDVLVSYDNQAPWSLWDVLRMREELEVLFGRNVDLLEFKALRNPFRRKRILDTREVIYVGGQIR